MYTRYRITIANAVQEYDLTYKLDDHSVAQKWAYLMTKSSVSNLRKSLNPWRGLVSNYEENKNEIVDLIQQLNSWIPEKIILTGDDWNQEGLNRLHVHFPELEKTETDPVRLKQLSKYNDLIHGLEHQYRNIKRGQERLYLLLCSDDTQTLPIEDSEYQYFSPTYSVGDLMLHYPHVGRHPFEILSANDLTVPLDQIVCQHRISTYHTLRFFEVKNYRDYFDKFYYSSGIQWPYAVDDPKLAFGYIHLGKIETESSLQEVVDVVKSCNKIVRWSVY